MNLTLIVPFYRNVKMLERQVQEWNLYPPGLEVVCIDDGSPEPAAPILDEGLAAGMRNHVRLYRIDVDIPWNRGGARNLGANKAATDWIVQVDIDHVLPADAAAKIRF
jgi:glycosyltransferase involved in cell wall biosynthesis